MYLVHYYIFEIVSTQHAGHIVIYFSFKYSMMKGQIDIQYTMNENIM